MKKYDENGNYIKHKFSTDQLKAMLDNKGDIGVAEAMLIKLFKWDKFATVRNLLRYTEFEYDEVEDNLEILKEKKLVFESTKYSPSSWVITDKGRDFVTGKFVPISNTERNKKRIKKRNLY